MRDKAHTATSRNTILAEGRYNRQGESYYELPWTRRCQTADAKTQKRTQKGTPERAESIALC